MDLSEIVDGFVNLCKNDDSIEWQNLVDSLRPYENDIWRNLDDAHRKEFLSKYRSIFETHRHRVAPNLCKDIFTAIREGRIFIHKGSVASTRELKTLDQTGAQTGTKVTLQLNRACKTDAIEFGYSTHGLAKTDCDLSDRQSLECYPEGQLNVDWVINSTGPGFD